MRWGKRALRSPGPGGTEARGGAGIAQRAGAPAQVERSEQVHRTGGAQGAGAGHPDVQDRRDERDGLGRTARAARGEEKERGAARQGLAPCGLRSGRARACGGLWLECEDPARPLGVWHRSGRS